MELETNSSSLVTEWTGISFLVTESDDLCNAKGRKRPKSARFFVYFV